MRPLAPWEAAILAVGTVAVAVLVALAVWSLLAARLRRELVRARALEEEASAATQRAEAERLSEQPDWHTLYLEECRKREEQFRMIEGIQRERDGWKDIFWQASREHGVAQEYMIRVNQYFAKLCGKNPDAKMPAMRKHFLEKYGEGARSPITERIGGPAEAGMFDGVLPVGSSVSAGGAAEISASGGEETSAAAVAKPEPNA